MLDVLIVVSPRSLVSLDEKTETMKMACEITVYYVNNHLKWDHIEYGINYTSIQREHVWTPDIIVANGAEQKGTLKPILKM